MVLKKVTIQVFRLTEGWSISIITQRLYQAIEDLLCFDDPKKISPSVYPPES